MGTSLPKTCSEADGVTCYLVQSTNERLEKKLIRELHRGTRVVSNSFTLPALYLLLRDEQAVLYMYNLAP